MKSIYSIFYEKLPSHSKDVLWVGDKKTVTFLNPYSLELMKDTPDLYLDFDSICSDGILPILLNRIWKHPKSERVSFDMSSLARELFTYIGKENGIYFIGARDGQIDSFVDNIIKEYPRMNVVGYHHGYIKGRFDVMARQIIACAPQIIIIGMGTPLQDEFAVYLRRVGYGGTIYTCGGFFHQSVRRIDYYPHWINKWNLRALYRMLKEHYVLKRILVYYPKFIIHYSLFLYKLGHARSK